MSDTEITRIIERCRAPQTNPTTNPYVWVYRPTGIERMRIKLHGRHKLFKKIVGGDTEMHAYPYNKTLGYRIILNDDSNTCEPNSIYECAGPWTYHGTYIVVNCDGENWYDVPDADAILEETEFDIGFWLASMDSHGRQAHADNIKEYVKMMNAKCKK